MTGAIAATVFAGYLWMFQAYYRRFPHKRPERFRVVFFGLSTLIFACSLAAPLDVLSDSSFAWHMVQHLAIIFVAPPLFLLGAPLLYLLGTLPNDRARRLSQALNAPFVRTILSPIPAWLAFVAALWISHFSPLYNAALSSPGVHLLEHALYIGTALLFWSAVVQTGFVPHPLAFPARMLYVFLAIPQGAFLGLALYQTRQTLYAHYASGHALPWVLADQHAAGALMWIGGGMLFFTAFMLTAAMWAIRERHGSIPIVIAAACFAALATGPVFAAQDYSRDRDRSARTLFNLHCASCHGLRAQGSALGPRLIGTSATNVHFMLDTGRMPAEIPYVEQQHVTPSFSTQQIDALVRYVDRLTKASDITLPHVGRGNAARGRVLYAENCEQCHGVGGNGGAVGYGYSKIAPSLDRASSLQIAEAIRVGPGVMPRFGTTVLNERAVSDIASYVNYLYSQKSSPGGYALSDVGPVAEGFVAWFLGLGLMVALVRRLSEQC